MEGAVPSKRARDMTSEDASGADHLGDVAATATAATTAEQPSALKRVASAALDLTLRGEDLKRVIRNATHSQVKAVVESIVSGSYVSSGDDELSPEDLLMTLACAAPPSALDGVRTRMFEYTDGVWFLGEDTGYSLCGEAWWLGANEDDVDTLLSALQGMEAPEADADVYDDEAQCTAPIALWRSVVMVAADQGHAGALASLKALPSQWLTSVRDQLGVHAVTTEDPCPRLNWLSEASTRIRVVAADAVDPDGELGGGASTPGFAVGNAIGDHTCGWCKGPLCWLLRLPLAAHDSLLWLRTRIAKARGVDVDHIQYLEVPHCWACGEGPPDYDAPQLWKLEYAIAGHVEWSVLNAADPDGSLVGNHEMFDQCTPITVQLVDQRLNALDALLDCNESDVRVGGPAYWIQAHEAHKCRSCTKPMMYTFAIGCDQMQEGGDGFLYCFICFPCGLATTIFQA